MSRRNRQKVIVLGGATVTIVLVAAAQLHFLTARETSQAVVGDDPEAQQLREANYAGGAMPRAEMPAPERIGDAPLASSKSLEDTLSYMPPPDALREVVSPDAATSAAPGLASASDGKIGASLRPAFEKFQAGEYEQALWLAEPIAKAGDPRAQHLVGYIHERGLAGRRDLALSRRYYQRAAEAGYVDAEISLGLLIVQTAQSERDYAQAVRWFRNAASKDDARAIAQLGALYAEGRGVPRDEIAAMSLFEQAAAMGSPQALFFLGMSSLDGRGRDQDPTAAAEYLLLAAKAGHVEAAYNLALIYRSDLLGGPDKAEATRNMRIAAEAGYGPALTAMGLYAHNGDADGKAADWFERASAAGDLQGRLFFAVALAQGDGRERDVQAAQRLAGGLAEDPDAPAEIAGQARRLLADLGATDVVGGTSGETTASAAAGATSDLRE